MARIDPRSPPVQAAEPGRPVREATSGRRNRQLNEKDEVDKPGSNRKAGVPESPACTPLREGLHYPRGGGLRFITKAEAHYNLCPAPPHSRQFVSFATPQFSSCFLERFVDIARVMGRELGILYDAERGGLILVRGDGSSLVSLHQDAHRYTVVLHVHPRATKLSPDFTRLSVPDVTVLVIYSLAHPDVPVISSVGGRICGGELQLSAVAIEGSQIFTTDDRATVLTESALRKLSQSPGIREAMEKQGIDAYAVTFDPKTVEAIAARYKFSGEAERAVLQRAERLAGNLHGSMD